MARKAREKSSTGMYNIIAKSTDVLFKNEEDYDFFVEILNEYIPNVYAFALTPYVICLAAKESDKGIGMDMKPLITKYARYYNRTYQSEGKIFEDRFKSEPIESKKELENSKAILSAIVSLLGKGGRSSQKSEKEYEMIEFYAKLLDVEVTPIKKKSTSAPKKKPVTKKPTVKKQAEKQPPKQEQVQNSEQQRKKLPTWLL